MLASGWLIYLKKMLKKYFESSVLFTFIALLSITTTLAAPRTNPFTLGQTIDPGAELTQPCGPLDVNCFVAVLGADDEGTSLTNNVLRFNFVGAGVTASNTAGVVTVNIQSGGGITALTNGKILIGNASGTAAEVSVATLLASSTTNFLNFSSTTNKITSNVNGVIASSTIDGLTNVALKGTTTVSGSIDFANASVTGLISNTISAITGAFTNLFTSNLTATGTVNLTGQTNISSTTIGNANINSLTLNPIATGTAGQPILVRDPVTGEVKQISTSDLLASNTVNVINYSTSTGANVITSTVNGKISTTTITELSNINLTGTTTAQSIMATTVQAVTGMFTNLFSTIANFGTTNTGNLTATGTTNLATTNISGPLNATSTTLNGTTTISGPLVLSPAANASLAAITASNTTNVIDYATTTGANVITSTVNGKISTTTITELANIKLTGNANIVGGTTTISGALVNNAATTNTGTTTNSGAATNNGPVTNNSTTTLNGPLVLSTTTNAALAAINASNTTNTISIAGASNTITSTVNGVVATTNIATLNGLNLTGTTTSQNIQNSGNIVTNAISAVTGYITNLFFTNATGTNLTTSNLTSTGTSNLANLTATGTTNLATTNISGPLTATSSTLNGTTTITGPLVLSTEANNSLAAINASNTTNVIGYSTSTGANIITSTVNGKISTTTITELANIKLTGTTTSENIQNSGNFVTNTLSAMSAYIKNLIFENATGTNLTTSNLTATGTSNLATINSQTVNASTTNTGTIISNNSSSTNILGTNATITNLVTNTATFGPGTTTFTGPVSFASLLCTVTGNFFCEGGNTRGVDSVLGTNDAFSQTFETSGVERMRIDPNGNVGIGTNAPLLKFQVLPSNDGHAAMFGFSGLGANNPYLFLGNLEADNLSYIDANSISGNTSLAFRNNSIERMRLLGNGYLGLGTSTPIFDLQVKKTVAGGVATQVENTDVGASSYAETRAQNGSISSVFGAYKAGGYGYFGTESNDDFAFQTNNIQRGVVTAAGNFGIGSLAPTNVLHVISSADPVRLEGLQTGSATNGIVVANAQGVLKTISSASLLSCNTTNALNFTNGKLVSNVNGVNATTTIPGTENIVEFGVNFDPNTAGTTFVPAQPSDTDVIYTSILDNSNWKWNGTSYVTYTPVNNNWALNGNTVTSAKSIGTKNAFDLPFITNNIEKMRLLTSGYLGLGTVNPNYKLQINDTAAAASSILQLTNNTSGSGATDGTILGTLNSGITALYNMENNAIVFGTNGNLEKMRIQANGNVGINNNNPVTKFSVNGGYQLNRPASMIDWATSNTLGIVGSAGAGGDGLQLVPSDLATANGYITMAYPDATTFRIGSQYDGNIASGTFRKIQLGKYNAAQMTVDTASGNVGVGTVNPGNKFEITQGSSGNSGLRFTNLLSTSATTTSNGKALTVNASGDVVLVDSVGSAATASNGLTASGTNIKLGGTLTQNTDIASAGFNLGLSGTGSLLIGSSTLDSAFVAQQTLLGMTGNINNYIETNIRNLSTGNAAQSGYTATADNGSATTNFMWMGINGSGYNATSPINVGGANDVNLLGLGNDMYVANGTAGRSMSFLTGGVSTTTNTRMFISPTGKVGVGTISPLNRLQVVNSGTPVAVPAFGGGITITDTNSARLYTETLSSPSGARVLVMSNQNGKTGFSSLTDNASAVVKDILSMDHVSGNVGIGTNSPTERLTVLDSVTQPIALVSNGGNAALTPLIGVKNAGVRNGYLGMDTASSTLFLLNYGAGTLDLANNGIKSSVVLTEFGKFGIGTTIPSTRLHVAGATSGITAPSSDAALTLTGSLLPRIYWENTSNTSGSRVMSGTMAATGLVFDTLSDTAGAVATATILALNTNGNVGMGTAAPTSKLSVNGTADKVGGGTWGTFSDERLKKNVNSFTSGLSDILAINPKTFQYNGLKDFAPDNGETYVGILAQQMQQTGLGQYTISSSTSGYLKYDSSALTYSLVNAIKEQQELFGKFSTSTLNGLTLISEATSTTVNTYATTTVADMLVGKVNNGMKVLTDFVAIKVTAVRGYFDEIYAKKIHTDQICVKKSDNTEICVDGDKLQSIVNGNVQAPANNNVPVNNSGMSTTTATTTSIGIILLGNNPLTIASTTLEYAEPGATALDDLGSQIPVTNDSLITMGSTSLSVPGNYTVTYTASNAGVTATSTRTVIVE
jgi:Domain of unknown function (DUF5011)/Chaperone of endosialidase